MTESGKEYTILIGIMYPEFAADRNEYFKEVVKVRDIYAAIAYVVYNYSIDCPKLTVAGSSIVIRGTQHIGWCPEVMCIIGQE